MKVRYLIPVLLVLFGCSEPVPRNLDTLVQQGDVYLDRETMLPYSGPIFSLIEDDSSKVKMSTTLKDGLMHGPFEEYYDNGQLWEKGSYSNGEWDGPFEEYYFNGQLWEKGSFSNGERDGPWEYYYDNGRLSWKGSYSNGELHGLYESYYVNGQLSAEGSYSNGERDGPWEYYSENGQLRRKGSYSNGKQCGEWFEDGEAVTYDPCPSN